MRRTLRHHLVRATTVALGATLLWLLAPTAVGGRVSYVTASGVSMKPALRAGDMALLRTSSQYRVGDVVAYRSRMLHATVTHRIVARDGDRYVFKGDDNSWLDPEHVTK